MLTPFPCRSRQPALFQHAGRSVGVERSLEIKWLHSTSVKFVVLTRACEQIKNRTALLRGFSDRCWPSGQLERIPGHRRNLFRLRSDKTSIRSEERRVGKEC